MSKMNIVLIVLFAGVLVSNVLSWLRVGGVSKDEVRRMEAMWQDSIRQLRMEHDVVRGEWVEWGKGVEMWRASVDSSVVVWIEAQGGRKKIEEWFRKNKGGK